jgi:hypothetical protein
MTVRTLVAGFALLRQRERDPMRGLVPLAHEAKRVEQFEVHLVRRRRCLLGKSNREYPSHSWPHEPFRFPPRLIASTHLRKRPTRNASSHTRGPRWAFAVPRGGRPRIVKPCPLRFGIRFLSVSQLDSTDLPPRRRWWVGVNARLPGSAPSEMPRQSHLA